MLECVFAYLRLREHQINAVQEALQQKVESFLLFKVKLSTECGWTWLCSGHFAALPLCLSVMEELVFSGLSCPLCIFNHSSVLLLTATQLWMLYY